MAFDPSLSSISADRWNTAAARHLLMRAGFGGSPQDIAELHALGLGGAIARLVDRQGVPKEDLDALPDPDIDPDVMKPATPEQRRAFREARNSGDEQRRLAARDQVRALRQAARRKDRQMFGQLQQWWLARMLDTPAPLTERLTLLWHNHFAAGHRSVRDAYLMYVQNAMFRAHSTDFADLARGIIHDPAMIKYLNNDRNVARKPNENLARELMELFTLGEGNYDERDIKEGARALTGYAVNDNDFLFRKTQHDDGTKRILGRRGNFDGDAFVSILLRQKACPRFVALKLYDHFVYDVGDDWSDTPRDRRRVIDALAQQITKHNYNLMPVLRKLFASRHFHDPANVGQKIKSPTQLVVGTVRALATPTRNPRDLGKSMSAMGQVLFEPPSVNGWDSGRAWINTSTLFVRQNLAVYLITGKRPNAKFRKDGVNYDPTPLLAGLEDRTPQRIVDHLCDALVGGHINAQRRQPLYAFAQGRGKKGPDHPDALVGLLCMITAMPEYQLC